MSRRPGSTPTPPHPGRFPLTDNEGISPASRTKPYNKTLQPRASPLGAPKGRSACVPPQARAQPSSVGEPPRVVGMGTPLGCQAPRPPPPCKWPRYNSCPPQKMAPPAPAPRQGGPSPHHSHNSALPGLGGIHKPSSFSPPHRPALPGCGVMQGGDAGLPRRAPTHLSRPRSLPRRLGEKGELGGGGGGPPAAPRAPAGLNLPLAPLPLPGA